MASTINPSPPHVVPESITSTLRPGCPAAISSAAWRADSAVPEMPPAMWTDTTSRPSATSGSYTDRKSPTDGCEVVGRSPVD